MPDTVLKRIADAPFTRSPQVVFCLLLCGLLLLSGCGQVAQHVTEPKDDTRAALLVQLATGRAEIAKLTKKLEEADAEIRQIASPEGHWQAQSRMPPGHRYLGLSPNAPIIVERDRLRHTLKDLRIKEAGLAAQLGAISAPSQ
jgi:hypothetical protein